MTRRPGAQISSRPRSAAESFDYAAPAEMFMARAKLARSPQIGYRRFKTAAEAIQFAVEEIPAPLLKGTIMEVREERFDHQCIRELYERATFPLARR